MQAAASMQMRESASISRVKNAGSTELKVIGLTTTTREQNLSLIVSALKNHMEKCAQNDPPEHPNAALVYKDLEDIGIQLEFKCFDVVKAVSIYRRNVAKEVQAIRSSPTLYSAIKNHVPKKHASFGGDYKTIVSDLRDRYGKDVVDELETEIGVKKNGSDEKKKAASTTTAKKFHQSNRDGLSQMKMNAFLVSKDIKKEEEKNESITVLSSSISSSSSDDQLVIDESSNAEGNNKVNEKKSKENCTIIMNDDDEDDDDDSDLIKLEQMKHVLQQELQQMPEKDDSNEVIIINESEEMKVTTNNDIDGGDGFALEQSTSNVKRKADRIPENDQNRLKQRKLENPESSSMSPVISNELTKKRGHNKKKISQLVISSLNTFYHSKKIGGANPKELFKTMARQLTHFFYEKNPDKIPSHKDVREYICKLFYNSGVIETENDFELV
jgi:hypothetical protein